jgi:hypothetical protein
MIRVRVCVIRVGVRVTLLALGEEMRVSGLGLGLGNKG